METTHSESQRRVSVRERFTDTLKKTVVELSVHHMQDGSVIGGFWVEIPGRRPLWVPLPSESIETIRDAVRPRNV